LRESKVHVWSPCEGGEVMYETLKVELEGAAVILTLNVPEKLNDYTKKMRRELLHFWRERTMKGSARW
jgi:enoyl-CoA hydratase/carnithine racemase